MEGLRICTCSSSRGGGSASAGGCEGARPARSAKLDCYKQRLLEETRIVERNSMPLCRDPRLQAVRQAKQAEDVLDVLFDGVFGYVELPPDRAIRFAIRQTSQDRQLTVRQRILP